MNIDLELYRVFYVVANNQNITKASKELNVSQPAISKAIKNLEYSLGGKLFTRTKKGVVLTKEGEEFYRYIKEAMEYINNAENIFTQMINLEKGTIRIGISSTLAKNFLIPYLEKFHKLYPNIKIEINTNLWRNLFSKLRNGLIDMIIFHVGSETYGSDINIVKCKEVHDTFIVNKDYKQLIGKEISVKELNNYPLIIEAKDSSARTHLDNFLKTNNIIINPDIELTSYSLVTELTKIGFGIGYATKEYIEEDIKKGKLYELETKEKIPPRYIGIALSKNNLPNFSTQKMIELIKNN